MTTFKLNVLAMMIANGLTLFPVLSVEAQEYPSKPITMIVPFNPGGAADATGRVVAEGLSRELGTNVLVENVGGAGGAIGTTRVKSSDSDGYTIGLGHMGTLAAAVPLAPNLAYDPMQDFKYLGLVTTSPNVVYVHKSHPATDLKSFIEYSKSDKGPPNMGHGGKGAASHVACVMFFQQIGAEANLVAYKGFGQTVTDILAERIDGGCDLLASVAPNAKAGDLRVLAIAAEKRSPVLPDAPTSAESGLPEFRTETWTGLFVPKETPDELVKVLEEALSKVLDDPAVSERLAAIGADVPDAQRRSSTYMEELVKREIATWTTVLAEGKAGQR
nr:tripartite tricarboxylate transporter substrate binding protein [Rhizobium sp. Khangiran2]